MKALLAMMLTLDSTPEAVEKIKNRLSLTAPNHLLCFLAQGTT